MGAFLQAGFVCMTVVETRRRVCDKTEACIEMHPQLGITASIHAITQVAAYDTCTYWNESTTHVIEPDSHAQLQLHSHAQPVIECNTSSKGSVHACRNLRERS